MLRLRGIPRKIEEKPRKINKILGLTEEEIKEAFETWKILNLEKQGE